MVVCASLRSAAQTQVALRHINVLESNGIVTNYAIFQLDRAHPGRYAWKN